MSSMSKLVKIETDGYQVRTFLSLKLSIFDSRHATHSVEQGRLFLT